MLIYKTYQLKISINWLRTVGLVFFIRCQADEFVIAKLYHPQRRTELKPNLNKIMRLRRLIIRLLVVILGVIVVNIIHERLSINIENISAIRIKVGEQFSIGSASSLLGGDRHTIVVNDTSQLRWIVSFLQQTSRELTCVNEQGKYEPCDRILNRIDVEKKRDNSSQLGRQSPGLKSSNTFLSPEKNLGRHLSTVKEMPISRRFSTRRSTDIPSPKTSSQTIRSIASSQNQRRRSSTPMSTTNPSRKTTLVTQSFTSPQHNPASSRPLTVEPSATTIRHNFPTIVEPSTCTTSGHGVDDGGHIVVVVKSIANNTYIREAIRQTWASLNRIGDQTFRFVFVCGTSFKDKSNDDNKVMSNSESLSSRLHSESLHFDDLLVGQFEDDDKSGTLKAMTAIDWVSRRCPNATYVVMTTEYLFLHTFRLRLFLNVQASSAAGNSLFTSQHSKDSLVFVCHVNRHAPVIRTPG